MFLFFLILSCEGVCVCVCSSSLSFKIQKRREKEDGGVHFSSNNCFLPKSKRFHLLLRHHHLSILNANIISSRLLKPTRLSACENV
jgi:hypothetical protein